MREVRGEDQASRLRFSSPENNGCGIVSVKQRQRMLALLPSATYGLFPRIQSSMGTVSLISKGRMARRILTRIGLLSEDMDEGIIKPSDVFIQVLALGMSEEQVFRRVGSVRAVGLDLRTWLKRHIPLSGKGLANLGRIPILDDNFKGVATLWFPNEVVG